MSGAPYSPIEGAGFPGLGIGRSILPSGCHSRLTAGRLSKIYVPALLAWLWLLSNCTT
ncbi:MAG: hypothetical protein MUE44_10515 [Oscillatoriaceae cyanobacterium Prado104]|nr:hypothetical protein [Oscillatoriaceae cyanobacterium Prado104]